MPVRLRSIIADLIPGRDFANELMELVFQAAIGIQCVCGYRKTVLIREDLAKRSAAKCAKAPAIFVRGLRLVQLNVFFPLHPF
ncbi:hypothetical protein RA19_02040 [Leisingera sp. ANG-M1]|nr:hypothetical protein RA19_02040 [Leisingera sp. ANG-M1]